MHSPLDAVVDDGGREGGREGDAVVDDQKKLFLFCSEPSQTCYKPIL